MIEDYKGLSKQELVNLVEDIKKKDKEIKAFITYIEEPEVNQGPLSGVPIAIKDNIVTKEIRTTCASKILENYIPPYDATVVKKLKEAGFSIIGKTNLDEFAMGSSTEKSAFFPTRNPHDLDRVPGGSSGGSAAAVAANMVPVALGSDTGGSIRQPAAFTGIFGFKPSYGLVSRYGLVAFASSLDQIGPLAKTVKDIATIMQVIHGKDKMDSTTLDVKMDFFKELEEGISGMKFAYPKEAFEHEGLHDDVAKSFEQFIKLLERLGANVEKVSLPHLKYSVAVYYIIAPSEVSSNLARFDGVRYGLREEGKNLKEMYMKTRNAGFGEEVKRRILLGTFTLSAAYYEAYFDKAQRVRRKISQEMYEVLKDRDAIIMPTAPTPAPKIGEIKDPLTYYLMDIFTIPANLAGLPAINIPFGKSGHLPLGMQVIGGRLKDPGVLRIARAIERVIKE